MRKAALDGLSTAQLIERFIAVSLEQDEAELLGDTYKMKPLYRAMVALEEELKARAGDQRRALLQLYDHPNTQVRLNAAMATLAVSPHAARKALDEIWTSKWFPQAAVAGMMIKALDDGTYRPT